MLDYCGLLANFRLKIPCTNTSIRGALLGNETEAELRHLLRLDDFSSEYTKIHDFCQYYMLIPFGSVGRVRYYTIV